MAGGEVGGGGGFECAILFTNGISIYNIALVWKREETGDILDKQPSHTSYTPPQDPSHTCSLSPKPNAPLRLKCAISGPQVSKQLVVRFELRFRSGESIVRGGCGIGGGWRGFGDRCGRGRAGCSGRCCGLFELRC